MEKLTTYTKIAIMLILALLLKNCRENVRKEERFGPRAPISEKLTYQLKIINGNCENIALLTNQRAK